MNQEIPFTATDFHALKPIVLLCLFGCGILLTDFLLEKGQRWWNAVTALIGEAAVAWALLQHGADTAAAGRITALGGAIVIDSFSVFFNWIFVASAVLAIVISVRYLQDEGAERGEFYALMLFAQAGMATMASSYDLVTLFIGLELMALSFYVMVGFLRDQKRANEAAMKYLILGAFSGGLLAYGFSIFYGISGSTNLSEIAGAVSERGAGDYVVLLAMIMTSIGLFFKIGVVPFHMWAPDVYEGAPTPITAFVSVASKAASFAMLLRIYLVALPGIQDAWEPLLASVALVTMVLGNFAALTQSNIKRLLAYSSISHAGYMLLGLVAANETGLKGIAVYLLAYVFMNFGAFAVVAMMRREGEAAEEIEDLAGLVERRPGYAILLLIFMLSLAGIPPLAGFYGKYFIFLGLLETGHAFLAVVAALYVAVAAYYYFRIVRAAFMQTSDDPARMSTSLGVRFAVAVSGIFTLWIGLYPEPFIRFASETVLVALR